ncbi:MAG TPA: hypothetical protein VIL28_10245 [Steroidobacteraceae bacterium]
MTINRISLVAWTASMAFAMSTAMAAETPAPEQDETAPKAASSPHQREATSTDAQEAPASAETDPATASSPHQREATGTQEEDRKKLAAAKGKTQRDQMMSECIQREQRLNSTLSTAQIEKRCMDQMRSRGEMDRQDRTDRTERRTNPERENLEREQQEDWQNR